MNKVAPLCGRLSKKKPRPNRLFSMNIPKKVTDFEEKVVVLRRYQTAKNRSSNHPQSIPNAPLEVELWIDGNGYAFTLTGGEMNALLSRFHEIGSIDELFGADRESPIAPA